MKLDRKITSKFLAYTFLLTYFAWGSIIAANQFGYLKYGTPVGMVVFLIGGNAPPIVSYVLLRRSGVFTSFRSFLRRAFSFRQSPVHYAIVIGFVALYFGIPAVLGHVSIDRPLYISVLAIPLMIPGGGLEELGWRYVLQPSLERRLPFVIATSVTACIWTLWHLPLFYIAGTAHFGGNFVVFGIGIFGLAFALATIYRVSQNIWLCILLHSLINAFLTSFAIEDSATPYGLAAAVMILVSVTIVYFGRNPASTRPTS